MELELRQQPEVLAENLRNYRSALSFLVGAKYDMVLLAARGSSDHAALYARYLLEAKVGIPVSLAAPSVITKLKSNISYPRCLAIGISQSGAAPDVAEVLAYMRRQGHTTLAITNTANSRLTQEAEFSVLLGAGEEKAVAATKTYTASLLALHEVVNALSSEDLSPILPDQAWLTRCEAEAEEALGPVLRSSILFSLARGYNFCTAQETALKLMECALLPCKSYSTADFEHGPKALATHGAGLIVYGEVPGGLREQGALVVQAPSFGKGPEDAIAEIFFGQWLALLAARARGLNPDDPQFIRKVTMTL